MILAPSVLCPIDFSEASRGALRYAGAIAAHFGARLTLLTVNGAGDSEDVRLEPSPSPAAHSLHELTQFLADTYRETPHGVPDVELSVVRGTPALEILRASHRKGCDVIVMSTHGRTRASGSSFGGTASRVLGDTTVAVLVTPADDPGPQQLEGLSRAMKGVLAPVDLSAATSRQLTIARGLAAALAVPLQVLHVIESCDGSAKAHFSPADGQGRRRAVEQQIRRLVSWREDPEIIISHGNAAEEIARVAQAWDTGVIVMGLHATGPAGRPMGTVTAGVLSQTRALVLALPPADSASRPQTTEPWRGTAMTH